MATLPARFVKKIVLEPVFGCWLWTGELNDKGYGRCYRNGRRALAHRVAFAAVRGYQPKLLDHLCRVRCCVNPNHLEDVDLKTNVLRGEGFYAKNARKTHCPKGHPLVPGNLVRTAELRGWRSCLTCQRAFGRACERRRSEGRRLQSAGS